jgi:hypothetical protein
MLKYLAVLAVLCGLTVYVSVKDERAAEQSAQKAAELHKSTISAKPDEQHPQENIENTERNLPSWYGFFRWPNGTTTWAILLTLMAIAEQTGQTKKATEAARDSAKAAMLNAQAVINSERAWMFVELAVPTDIAGAKTIYDISCVNRGKTPARITDCRIGYCFVDDPENLSLKAADYHPAVMPFPTVKASDNGFRVDRIHPGAKWTERKPGDDFLMYFGYVLYEDIFPIGKHGELGQHETWWCLAYSPYLDSLTPSGPDRYTKNT